MRTGPNHGNAFWSQFYGPEAVLPGTAGTSGTPEGPREPILEAADIQAEFMPAHAQ